MQNPKVCRTLLDVLEAEKRWAERQQLQGLTPVGQLAALEKLLKEAVGACDDGYASLVVEWALRLFEDIHLQPLVGPHGQAPVGLNAVEATECSKAAATVWAMRIWSELPANQDGKQYVRIAEDAGEMQPAKFATLTETKKVLLTAIVARWRQTKNETEADRILDFLRQLDSDFEEDVKMFESAFRFGTDKGFPPPRAMRQYLIVEQYTGGRMATESPNTLANLLTMAWARNSNWKTRALVFGAGRSVLSLSPGAFARLLLVAESLGRVDEQMQKLVEALQPSPFTSGFKTEISYGADGGPILTIRYGSNCFLGYLKPGSRMQFSVTKAQERFWEFRHKVDEWREQNGTLKFLLVMEVAGEKDNKPHFRDEHIFN